MAEYYQHRDIIIRFDVFEDGDEITPRKASVLIYDPDKDYIGQDFATIKGSEVRYILVGKKVKKIGIYSFVFKVRVRGLGDYTHVVKVTTKKLPV